MPPKPKEDKTVIKQFRDSSSNFWCDMVHYHLNKQGELVFCAGGIDKEELRTSLLSFISRNKKSYSSRQQSIFETEEKEYTKIGFGKHFGKSTLEILSEDKQWLSWMYKNYTFKIGEEKLKQEIKELLKIK